MSALYGLLGLEDNDRSFINTIGQSAVYEAAQEVVARNDADLADMMAVFVERNTEDFKRRYKLPGGVVMPKLGHDSPVEELRLAGGWDVAFPLDRHGLAIGGSQAAMAYMTVQGLALHLTGIFESQVRRHRLEILHTLLDNENETYLDTLIPAGALTIRHLANDDTDGSAAGGDTRYPPVVGSDTEANEDHYLVAGYATANISDANNPLVTMRDDLLHHFGFSQGGDNVVVFGDSTVCGYLDDLTDFDPLSDRFVQEGVNVAKLFNLPADIPGRLTGRSNGCWVQEWRRMPANYLLAIHLDVEKPLERRVHPGYTGMGAGLQLVAEETNHPLKKTIYEDWFGYGCGNRLNGVVMYLADAEAYVVPSAYDHRTMPV